MEHNLSTASAFTICGVFGVDVLIKILCLRANWTFIHHGVECAIAIGDIKNVKINKKWLYSEIVIGLRVRYIN